MARNALKDTLVLHLPMLTRQCVVEEDAPRMRKVHDALQERCSPLAQATRQCCTNWPCLVP